MMNTCTIPKAQHLKCLEEKENIMIIRFYTPTRAYIN